MSLEKTGSKTASVFPVPVGAIRSTFFPCKMGGKARVCGRVGSVNPASARAVWTCLVRSVKTELAFSFCCMIFYQKD